MGKYVTTGMGSRTGDGRHVTFVDADGHGYERVRKLAGKWSRGELGSIPEEPVVLVFNARPSEGVDSKSWHLVGLAKRSRGHVAHVLQHHPLEDPEHATMGERLGRWILRIGGKEPMGPEAPEHEVTCVNAPVVGYNLSLAHMRLLSSLHPELRWPAERGSRIWDGSSKVVLEDYQTPMREAP